MPAKQSRACGAGEPVSSDLAHFGPRSLGLIYLSAGLALALIIVTVALWDTGRLVGLSLAQGLIVLAAFVLVNRQIALYATWSDLFGIGR